MNTPSTLKSNTYLLATILAAFNCVYIGTILLFEDLRGPWAYILILTISIVTLPTTVLLSKHRSFGRYNVGAVLSFLPGLLLISVLLVGGILLGISG